jgi:translation initiation factor 1
MIEVAEGLRLNPIRFHTGTKPMSGLFDGTQFERAVTCEVCSEPLDRCACPRSQSGGVLLPKDQPARVSREKRRGGKSVTVITGLDPVASNLNALLTRLKSVCAAGGAIKDGKIEIQGDHRERVLSILRELGYPAKLSGG